MTEDDIYSSSKNMQYGDGFSDDDAPQMVMPPPQPPQQPYRRERTPVSPNGYYPPNQQQYYPTGKKKKKHPFLKFLLILFLLAVIAFIVYVILVLGRIHYTNEDPDHSAAEAAGIELKDEPGVTNILLFGEDNHKDNERGRADTMILLSIDKSTGQLKQTSFMRDVYVTIPGFGDNKLNAAFSIGGPKLACETVEYNFGLRIDKYMVVDFNSFTDIIDSLGGIDLELTYDEVAYINWQSKKNHQTEDDDELKKDEYEYKGDNDGNFKALVHLNGRQALWYARDRDSAGSDFDRTQRQRIVMNTIFSRLKGSNPFTLMGSVFAVSGHLTTNMNPIEVTGAGFEIVSSMGYEKKEHRVPTSDNYYDAYFDHCGQTLVISDPYTEKTRLYDFIFKKAE